MCVRIKYVWNHAYQIIERCRACKIRSFLYVTYFMKLRIHIKAQKRRIMKKYRFQVLTLAYVICKKNMIQHAQIVEHEKYIIFVCNTFHKNAFF